MYYRRLNFLTLVFYSKNEAMALYSFIVYNSQPIGYYKLYNGLGTCLIMPHSHLVISLELLNV